MKCISLWQPWAEAMARGWKRNETRSWCTSYRGPLLIHAAKKEISWPSYDVEMLFEELNPDDFVKGGILCSVTLVDCLRITTGNTPFGTEKTLGDYTPGRFMWRTDNLKRFPPIYFRGRQGLFDVPDEIIRGAVQNVPGETKDPSPFLQLDLFGQ